MSYIAAIHGSIALSTGKSPGWILPLLMPSIRVGSDGQKGTKHKSGWKADFETLTAPWWREPPYCCLSLLEFLLLQILSLHFQNQQTTKITPHSGMRQSLLLLQEKQKTTEENRKIMNATRRKRTDLVTSILLPARHQQQSWKQDLGWALTAGTTMKEHFNGKAMKWERITATSLKNMMPFCPERTMNSWTMLFKIFAEIYVSNMKSK